jgi:heme A synthase
MRAAVTSFHQTQITARVDATIGAQIADGASAQKPLESFMNWFNRKVSSIAGLLVFGLVSTLAATAAHSTPTANTSCRQETRRVAVWPVVGNPKLQQIPRFEKRSLVVCNHQKSISKPA